MSITGNRYTTQKHYRRRPAFCHVAMTLPRRSDLGSGHPRIYDLALCLPTKTAWVDKQFLQRWPSVPSERESGSSGRHFDRCGRRRFDAASVAEQMSGRISGSAAKAWKLKGRPNHHPVVTYLSPVDAILQFLWQFNVTMKTHGLKLASGYQILNCYKFHPNFTAALKLCLHYIVNKIL